jgi:DNA primase
MNSHQAKKVPLTEILDRLGYQPHHEVRGEVWYLSPFRSEQEPSFTVNEERNIWHDFGEGEGGNVIDFVMKHYGINDFSSALERLDTLVGGYREERDYQTRDLFTHPKPLGSPGSDESTLEVVKVQEIKNEALRGYLRERGISPQTANPHLKEIYYRRGGKTYFALAFPNDSEGYELRNRYFKGAHGSKDISSINGREGGVNTLLAKRKVSEQAGTNTEARTGISSGTEGSEVAVTVFEGFMDFLSALEHYHKPITTPVIVLNSVAMKDKAITAIRNMGAGKVYLYLDNDKAGRELTEHFREQLQGVTIVDNSSLYEGYKDFNEWLAKGRKQAVARQ